MAFQAEERRAPVIPGPEVQEHLEVVLRSRAFASSERLRALLRFIVEKSLAGAENSLKEYSIGIDVFGRSAEYDPRTDPTVRVHAGKLRDRLREYYATEGADAGIRIEVPKGSYHAVITAGRNGGAAHMLAEAVPAEIGSAGPVSRVWWIAAVTLATLLLLTAFWLNRSRRDWRASPHSIAVLPFVSRGPDLNDEYLTDSLTDELTNALARRTTLQVVGRTSASAFKGKATDIRQIGRTLNVDAVLEGSLRRDGEKLRMSVQVVGTRDGYQLWSGNWERPAVELLALQDDLTAAVVLALGHRPSTEDRHRPEGTRNRHAFNAYLLGRFYSNKLDPKSIETAIGYYKQAIAEDPRFAAAWAGLATAHALKYVYADEAPEIEKARTAATRALQIDPESSEAAAALAGIKGTYDYDWVAAEQLYRGALEKNPNDAAAHSAFGITHLAPLGRLDEALREVRRALELDPLSLRINNALALCYYYSRQYDKAIDQFQKTIRMDPNFALAHLYLGYTYAENAMYAEAVEALKAQPTQVWEGPHLGALGYVYARWNKVDEARRLMLMWRSHSTSMTESARAGSAVWFYLGLGQADETFKWLEKAVDRHWFWVNSLKVRPMFDPIRSDARYHALLRRLHLPD